MKTGTTEERTGRFGLLETSSMLCLCQVQPPKLEPLHINCAALNKNVCDMLWVICQKGHYIILIADKSDTEDDSRNVV